VLVKKVGTRGMAGKQAVVGVIGGSGLYRLDNLTVVSETYPDTPWGKPSSPIVIAALPSGTQVAFLARHGIGHTFSPSEVPSRANIAALKSLGVRAIIAFSAVGSLQEEIRPGDFVLPSQIIDRTKGVRPSSFFEHLGIVAHAGFGDPFDVTLSNIVEPFIQQTLSAPGASPSDSQVSPISPSHPSIHSDTGIPKPRLHSQRTLVCMEGPQFSTRAESHLYRSWKADVINMSALPEAKLAREAEIPYVMICMATDYDSWKEHEEPVTVEQVIRLLEGNAAVAKRVVANCLEHLQESIFSGKLDILKGSMRYSVITKPELMPADSRTKLAFILPEIFSGQQE